MNCYFCNRRIRAGTLNNHHLTPKCEGGTETVPTHKSCHIAYHSTQGDFTSWGRVGGQLAAITRRWAFYLKNVKDNPAFELDRQFFRLYYAEAV
jgi:hypothetical protein